MIPTIALITREQSDNQIINQNFLNEFDLSIFAKRFENNIASEFVYGIELDLDDIRYGINELIELKLNKFIEYCYSVYKIELESAYETLVFKDVEIDCQYFINRNLIFIPIMEKEYTLSIELNCIYDIEEKILYELLKKNFKHLYTTILNNDTINKIDIMFLAEKNIKSWFKTFKKKIKNKFKQINLVKLI